MSGSLRLLIFCCLLLLCRYECAGQLEVWRHINTSGMGSTNVNCITEDANGFMYFGTHEGLEVFDGRRFHQIKITGDAARIVNPFVNSFEWGAHGVLWVSTRTHIYTYQPATGRVRIVYGNNATDLAGSIKVDSSRRLLYLMHPDGILLFATTDTSLRPLKNIPEAALQEFTQSADGTVYLLQNNNRILGLRDSLVTTVYEAPFIKDIGCIPGEKALAMITPAGVEVHRLKRGTSDTIIIPDRPSMVSTKTRISALTGGRILLQHNDGATLINRTTGRVARYKANDNNPWTIKTNYINYAFTDRKGNIWVAEDGIGISVLAAQCPPVRHLPAALVGAARLWRLYHDSANKQIFAGSENGLSVIRYDADSVSYTNNIRPAGTKGLFEIMDYISTGPHELLLITNGQGLWRLNTSTYQLTRVAGQPGDLRLYGALPLSNERYLVYGGTSGIAIYNIRTNELTGIKRDTTKNHGRAAIPTLHYDALCAFIDSKRRIWVGSGTGLELVDSNFNWVKKFGDRSSGNAFGLTNSVILDLDEATDGTIYAASMGGGLFKLTPADTFTHVPLVGDLQNIYCIEKANDRHLVITTSKGLCLFDTKTLQSRLLNEINGVPITDFNQFALTRDNKWLLAAGAKGVVLLESASLLRHFYDTATLKVMQGSVSTGSITLQQGDHTLDADVTITGYHGSNKWRLQYRLEGVDDDWRTMTPGEWHIHYNSLQPGSYTLHIRAQDAQGVTWAAPIKVPITVLPFFWQTTLFKLLAMAIAIAILVVIVRYFSQLQLRWKLKKLEDEQKIIRERLRISRELHDNVGSQLTSIITGLEHTGLMLRKQQPEAIKDKLDHLHESARHSMHQLRDSIWALNSESVALSALLERFESWIRNITYSYPHIAVTIKNEVQHEFILDPVKSLNLFRIMQESIHNVLKHADATSIDVSYTTTNNKLLMLVADNGRGFESARKGGNGLKFMGARAEEITAELDIDSKPGQGTRVSLSIQLK